MKLKYMLFCILCIICILPVVSSLEINPVNLTQSWSCDGIIGWNITTLQAFTVYNVTTGSGADVTTAYIADENGTIIDTAEFVGAVATFTTPVSLSDATTYRIGCDKNGSSFTMTYETFTNYPWTDLDNYLTITQTFDNSGPANNWGGTSDYNQIYGIQSIGVSASVGPGAPGEPLSLSAVILSPADNYNTTDDNITISTEATVINGDLDNATLNVWYLNSSLYVQYTNYVYGFNLTNSTNFTVTSIPVGDYYYIVNWVGHNTTDTGTNNTVIRYFTISAPYTAPVLTNATTPDGSLAIIPGDFTLTFIILLFIIAIIALFYTFFMTIAKLVTADEAVYDVLLSWGAFILLIIVNHLTAHYVEDVFFYNLTGQFITLTPWTNVVLPLLAFIITIFIKSTQKKRILTPQEIGGFGRRG